MKLATLVCVAFATCAFAPSEAEPWTPPEHYREVWAQAEQCSGKVAPYDRVTFFVVPGHDFKCPSGRCIGQWERPHTIYLAEEWKTTDWVIRHEMIHEITRLTHTPALDSTLWGKQCHSIWGWLESSDPGYRP